MKSGVPSDSSSKKHLLGSSYGNPATTLSSFSCKFCTRKFFSSRALGGHQNAHKRERTEMTSMLSKQYYKPPIQMMEVAHRADLDLNQQPLVSSAHGGFYKHQGGVGPRDGFGSPDAGSSHHHNLDLELHL